MGEASEFRGEAGEITVDQLRTRFKTGLSGLGLGRDETKGADWGVATNSSAVMGALGLLLPLGGWYDS